jgi:S1-C subfamily serine protease
MVLTSSGEILTNNHVIRGATTIRIVVPGATHRYTARVVGYEVVDDVAVLKAVRASNLKTVSTAASAAVRVGARVTAVGNLQPGDSGGPLLNGSRKAIGMDTAAASNFVFRSTAGDGYAIKIGKALSLAKQIVAGHASARVHVGATAFLGVQVQSALPHSVCSSPASRTGT